MKMRQGDREISREGEKRKGRERGLSKVRIPLE